MASKVRRKKDLIGRHKQTPKPKVESTPEVEDLESKISEELNKQKKQQDLEVLQNILDFFKDLN